MRVCTLCRSLLRVDAQTCPTDETGEPQMFVASADPAIASGNLGAAKRDLDKAVAAYKASGTKNASIDYAYQRFTKNGSGGRVKRATDRVAEIADDIKELGPQ